ncbi:tetratricopeptide repeat protein [uncultured Algibacter sp.]|uniref:tetratricopeptide repeat protein n=1 Tax=uncultured Algibacter sp. TaxID=298659 RepID=UPI002629AB7F|nr:tetratricopeptide repeat protein [uncultured Algibacter sp.]
MKSKFTLLFLTLVIFNNLQGQNQKKIDSLIKIINNTKIDTIKANYYLELSNLTMYNDQIKTSEYLKKAEDLYSNSKNERGIAKLFAKKANNFYGMGKIDSALYYLGNSVKKYLQIKDTLRAAVIRHNIGITEHYQGNSKIAKEIMDKNIPIFKKYKDTLHLCNAYLISGKISMTAGFFKIGLKESFKALEGHKQIKDDFRIADDLLQIARIYNLTEDHKKAIETYKESIDYYNKVDNLKNKAQALNFMAYSQINLKKFEDAEKNLLESLTLSKRLKYKPNIARIYKNLGNIAYEKDNLNQSIKYLNDSYELWKSIGSLSNEATTLSHLGKTYFKKGNYMKSIEYLNKSISISKTNGYPNILRTAYLEKSIALEKINRYNKALMNFKQSKKITDSIYNIDKINAVEELKTIYETEKKEAQIDLQNEEIKTLNVQAKNDKLTKTLYGTGMISFIAIAGLLFFGFKQRIKKNQIAREKQEVIYKQEIEFKKKELASQTLHLVHKSTFIQELKENLEKIKKSPELFKVEFRRLVMLLKKEKAEDKDWEIFKSYFSEVHNNFDNKLKTIYADITEKEIRLASFLRMNLSTKEISSMLNVLPESVLKSKYRLKKKLNLTKADDLNTFLNSL